MAWRHADRRRRATRSTAKPSRRRYSATISASSASSSTTRILRIAPHPALAGYGLVWSAADKSYRRMQSSRPSRPSRPPPQARTCGRPFSGRVTCLSATRSHQPALPCRQAELRFAGRADLDLCQLRHHTKNALERISALVTHRAGSEGLGRRPAAGGRGRAAHHSGRPGLRCAVRPDATAWLHGGAATLARRGLGRIIRRSRPGYPGRGGLHRLVPGGPARRGPARGAGAGRQRRQARLLRAADGLRPPGTRLAAREATKLVVADDGWGLGHRPGDGQGLRFVRALIAPFGGTLSLRAGPGVTAELWLPAAGSGGRIATLVAQDGREIAAR